MRTWRTGRILCPMSEESGPRVSAVANAVLVLFLAVLPVSANGSEVDHEQVRPWGCRTCVVPPGTTPQAPENPGLGPAEGTGAGSGEGTGPGQGLDGDGTGAAAPLAPVPVSCGTNCPPLVEIMAAAAGARAATQCQPCPDEPDLAPATRE